MQTMTAYLDYLAANPAAFILAAAVYGLLAGSFLNVVVLRLPPMMEQDWASKCHAFFHEHGEMVVDDKKEPPLSLIYPPSSCPQCGHRIRAWENIPILSWLCLRGRCSSCKAPISIQYPLVEAVAALFAAVVAWRFGFGWPAIMAILFSWVLLVLSVIDLRTRLLPDSITLPFLWLGLLLNTGSLFTSPASAVVGAVAGYLLLWGIYHAFRLLTGKEGMGYGDFKLLAMIGAWLGWQMLPLTIIIAAGLGSVAGIFIILRGHDRHIPAPFGPWLATAGWLALMWGEEINRIYLNATGLPAM
jgi:leader peptidase (prepilin peptidase)/N-methyltransferase